MKEFLKSTWGRMNTNQRSWVIVVSAIVVMVFITAITGGSWLGLNDSDSKAKPKHKTTAVAKKNEEVKKETKKVAEKPVKKKPLTLEQYMKEENPSVTKITIGNNIEIQTFIQSNKKEKLSVISWDILQSLCKRKDYLNATTVTLITKADYTDKYGDVTKDITSTAVYKTSELKKVHWDTVDNSRIFNLASSVRFRHDVIF